MESADQTFPFHPVNLVNLYLFPRKFFTSGFVFTRRTYAWIAMGLYGATRAITRVDNVLFRIDSGTPRASDLFAQEEVAGSWGTFWLIVLLGAFITGFTYWWIAGWWFKARVGWSGAMDPDPTQARHLYAYSTLIVSLPVFAYTVLQVPFYPDYIAAYNNAGFVSILLVAFPFWALFTAYGAVRANFDVVTWKAVFWFIALPGGVYATGYVLLFFLALFQ